MPDPGNGHESKVQIQSPVAHDASGTLGVPPGQFRFRSSEDEIDLLQLWQIIWAGKWRVIATTFVFALLSVAYVLITPEWYRAEVLLAPSEQNSNQSLAGQLGGLAALAGVSIGDGDSADALATLKSRTLARDFITANHLMPVFFYKRWDESGDRWKGDDALHWPDERDGVKYFHQEILSVSQDRKSGLITLAIEWTDPELAAAWAMELVASVNSLLRERALSAAESNITYLQEQLLATNVVPLQQAMSRLLESELQKMMLARGNREFAFRVIDRAEPPRYPVRPNRLTVGLIGLFAGVSLGIAWSFISYFLRSLKHAEVHRAECKSI